MTALRLIPLQLHGAFEMLLGMVLMAAPLVLGMTLAAAVIGIGVGALLIGMGLASTGNELDVRGTLSVGAHHSVDYGLVTGLLGTAAIVGLAGDRRATYLFAAAGIVLLALNLTTRYSQR